jgi:hypothetical protein
VSKKKPQIRTGQADLPVPREVFNARFRARFFDPAFAEQEALIEQLLKTAWDSYQ